jgi:hypothetical protein
MMTNIDCSYYTYIIEGNIAIFALYFCFNCGTVAAESKAKTRSQLTFQACFTK